MDAGGHHWWGAIYATTGTLFGLLHIAIPTADPEGFWVRVAGALPIGFLGAAGAWLFRQGVDWVASRRVKR